MKECGFRNFPSKGGAMSCALLPHAPRKVHLWCIFFALLAMNGPLPVELKFRENTEYTTNRLFFYRRKEREADEKKREKEQARWVRQKTFYSLFISFCISIKNH